MAGARHPTDLARDSALSPGSSAFRVKLRLNEQPKGIAVALEAGERRRDYQYRILKHHHSSNFLTESIDLI